jgi:hypothetical protein
MKSLSLLAATAIISQAGTTSPITIGTSPAPSADVNPLNFIDAFRVSAYGNFGMDFKDSSGGLDAYQVELSSFLSKPISLGANITLLPTFRYEGTFLRYDGIPAGFPVKDEDLHSLELPLYFIHSTPSSPWIFGAWVKPSLSTDFDHIDTDDIFLDVALGAAYKFSDRLYIGGGVAAFDVFGDPSLIPGPGFIWMPTDDIAINLVGATFTADWKASENWKFGLDVRSAGGVWNIDDNHQSRTLDFTSFRAGLHADRRIVDTWWVEGGAGMTFANKIELRTHGGLGLNENVLGDLDEGVYGYLAVRKEVW